MKQRITRITKTYSSHSNISYTIWRGNDPLEFKGDRLSRSSRSRLHSIIKGHLSERTDVRDFSTFCVLEYTIEPIYQYGNGIRILKNGDMLISASPRARVELRRYVRENKGAEYDYRRMNESMYAIFEGGPLDYTDDAGESGWAMFSGPMVVEKVYYSEDDPRYDDSDDDLGCDWEASTAWYYNDYVFRHPIEDIIRKGYVIFNRVDD